MRVWFTAIALPLPKNSLDPGDVGPAPLRRWQIARLQQRVRHQRQNEKGFFAVDGIVALEDVLVVRIDKPPV